MVNVKKEAGQTGSVQCHECGCDAERKCKHTPIRRGTGKELEASAEEV